MRKEDPFYQEAYSALKSSKLFGVLDDVTTHELLDNFKIVHWKKSETIDHEIGQKYCHFIVKGRLKITQVDPDTGRTIAPFLLSSGDIFDVFALLDGEEHVVFPIALDQVTALYLPLEEARKCLCEHPEFNKQFLPYLGSMMRQLENFSSSLVFHDTTTRLANLILRHTHPQKDPEDGHCKVDLINNLSHESLAEMIGSVRSVVSSQMHKLKEENIIFSKRGHLAVKNFEKLLHKIDHFPCKEK
jgi:CRP-like cAMP-binding protein